MSTAYYNPSYLAEQREKARYKGRGKYKRKIQQYFIYYLDKEGKEVGSGIAFGWRDMMRQRGQFRSGYHHRYKVKIQKGVYR